MRFDCDYCGRPYVADATLRGRAFRMRCRGCGHVLTVSAIPAATAVPRAAFDPFDDEPAPQPEPETVWIDVAPGPPTPPAATPPPLAGVLPAEDEAQLGPDVARQTPRRTRILVYVAASLALAGGTLLLLRLRG